MKATIEGYGLPGPLSDRRIMRVTPMETAQGGPDPRQEVTFLETPLPIEDTPDLTIARVWFDLPLNGEWSDLTATFQVRQNDAESVLILNEIHVF